MSSLFDSLATLTPTDPPEPRRKRLGATTDSIALIACNGGCGVILEHDGPGIEAAVDGECNLRLEDHGLDDAPDGLSIWEGRYACFNTSYEYSYEYECELDGKFRDLTDREWDYLRETGTPWEYEEKEVLLVDSSEPMTSISEKEKP